MSSVIFYKFKNQSKFNECRFDGKSLTAKEVREYIRKKHFNEKKHVGGKRNESVLRMSDVQGNDFKNDKWEIKAGSAVIVKRSAPEQDTLHQSSSSPPSSPSSPTSATAEDAEQQRMMEAMQVMQKQETRLGRASHGHHSPRSPVDKITDKPPHASAPFLRRGVVCRSCGQEGHFQRDCPTSPSPLSLLPNVRPPPGYKCNGCGSDEHYRAHCKGAMQATMIDVPPTNTHPMISSQIPAHLLCDACGRLLVDPVVLGCCSYKRYCRGCVLMAMAENNGQCPNPRCPMPVDMNEVTTHKLLQQEVADWKAEHPEPNGIQMPSSPIDGVRGSPRPMLSAAQSVSKPLEEPKKQPVETTTTTMVGSCRALLV